MKTPREVIAQEIMMEGDLWDLDDSGMAAADGIIAQLERHGYKIIRHRVLDEPLPPKTPRC